LLAQRRMQQGARQVLVVPNGVDLSLFARARQKAPHSPTLIYMGTLSPLWGIDLAIKSMPALLQAIPNIRLLIAGAGPAEADLRALSQTLDVAENVSFLGRLEYHALPAVLAKADIGIATSLPDSTFRKYASPLKLIEYMAAGLPVIATRIGQTEITMQQADAGILIDHSVEGFVAAAVSLLSDKTLYKHCSQAAITYAANFDWDLLLDQAYQYMLHIMADDQVPDALSVLR
jgi:glycosyltransferase involved in cell wall biosynthesis